MLVRDIPQGERPTDRLARLGPKALGDAELLSILLGGQTALSAAHLALKDGLARLRNRAESLPLSEIRQARIRALIELADRLEILHTRPPMILQPHEVARYLMARYSREPQERLGVVLLNARRHFIAEREVYVGHHKGVAVSPRWILKHAFVENADAIIAFHNHPSGDPQPSLEDTDFTASLKRACIAVDVELFDHIIVGRHAYYSFRDKDRL